MDRIVSKEKMEAFGEYCASFGNGFFRSHSSFIWLCPNNWVRGFPD